MNRRAGLKPSIKVTGRGYRPSRGAAEAFRDWERLKQRLRPLPQEQLLTLRDRLRRDMRAHERGRGWRYGSGGILAKREADQPIAD